MIVFVSSFLILNFYFIVCDEYFDKGKIILEITRSFLKLAVGYDSFSDTVVFIGINFKNFNFNLLLNYKMTKNNNHNYLIRKIWPGLDYVVLL